jgi:glyoxylase I family protein
MQDSMSIQIHHIALQTANFSRTFDFFKSFLGLALTKGPIKYKERTLCYFTCGNIQLELYSIKSSEQGIPYSPENLGPTHLALTVENMSDFINRCRDRNVAIIKKPFKIDADSPTIAFIEGPDSQEIEIREAAV